MAKKGHSEEEILRVLREVEAGETVVVVALHQCNCGRALNARLPDSKSIVKTPNLNVRVCDDRCGCGWIAQNHTKNRIARSPYRHCGYGLCGPAACAAVWRGALRSYRLRYRCLQGRHAESGRVLHCSHSRHRDPVGPEKWVSRDRRL